MANNSVKYSFSIIENKNSKLPNYKLFVSLTLEFLTHSSSGMYTGKPSTYYTCLRHFVFFSIRGNFSVGEIEMWLISVFLPIQFLLKISLFSYMYCLWISTFLQLISGKFQPNNLTSKGNYHCYTSQIRLSICKKKSVFSFFQSNKAISIHFKEFY